jgi:hypothetical protein
LPVSPDATPHTNREHEDREEETRSATKITKNEFLYVICLLRVLRRLRAFVVSREDTEGTKIFVALRVFAV